MKKSIKFLILVCFIFLGFNNTSKFVNAITDKWYRVWGGNGHNECAGISLDSSDNIFLAGDTESYGAGNNDICLVSYNHIGDFQWYKT